MYYNYNSNIKYVSLTIKRVNFESIFYAINVNAFSTYMIFSDFDF